MREGHVSAQSIAQVLLGERREDASAKFASQCTLADHAETRPCVPHPSRDFFLDTAIAENYTDSNCNDVCCRVRKGEYKPMAVKKAAKKAVKKAAKKAPAKKKK
jgi:hypothetical protein